MPAHCARDRLLEILAESAARLRPVPVAERRTFIEQHVATWRRVLAAEYGGETVRVTTEKLPREERAARDARILAARGSGVTARDVAQRERVSLRLVRMVWGRVQNAA